MVHPIPMEQVMDLTGPENEPRPDAGISPHVWREISLAPHRLLMLDHDGTLAPLVIARDRAVPSRETHALLERIATSHATSLVMISGRPIRELADLLGHPAWTLIGEHGWESMDPGERVARHALPRGVAARLDRAERLAREAGFADRLERKRTSLAVHTRGLDPGKAGEIEASATQAWAPLTDGAPMRMTLFHGGVELRAHGRDKGTAVRDLLAQARPGTLGVYVGDDRTDEDAFRALPPDGIGVRVGTSDAPTAASARLASTDDVTRFLARWLEVTELDARARA